MAMPMGRGGGRDADERVYKVERVGGTGACLAAAYHNAALRGWSTVFCCAVLGDGGDLGGEGVGLEGFERVGGLAALVLGRGEEGKVRVFY